MWEFGPFMEKWLKMLIMGEWNDVKMDGFINKIMTSWRPNKCCGCRQIWSFLHLFLMQERDTDIHFTAVYTWMLWVPLFHKQLSYTQNQFLVANGSLPWFSKIIWIELMNVPYALFQSLVGQTSIDVSSVWNPLIRIPIPCWILYFPCSISVQPYSRQWPFICASISFNTRILVLTSLWNLWLAFSSKTWNKVILILWDVGIMNNVLSLMETYLINMSTWWLCRCYRWDRQGNTSSETKE